MARNRDAIANSGGIEPLIKLLDSETVGTPEIAARALASLARADDEELAEEMQDWRLDGPRTVAES